MRLDTADFVLLDLVWSIKVHYPPYHLTLIPFYLENLYVVFYSIDLNDHQKEGYTIVTPLKRKSIEQLSKNLNIF